MPESRDNGRRRFVSAQDVAERAGVSRSAVSRAFTPGASIAPATRARVEEAASALGYQVNDLARGLHAHRSQLVGLVASDTETPFRAQSIAALSRALIERGNVPALIGIGPTAEDVANAARQLLSYRAEATVFLSGSPPASLVELTRRNGQTLILINRAETDVDSVRCDDRGGTRQAFEALHATGAARFAVVNMANPSPGLAARERAFAAFAAARGITPIVVRAGHSDYAGGQEAARRLLAGGRPPEAVFCVNDLMAFGALDLLRGAGLRVPDDVSIIGFDDVPMAGWASYALTTLRQDPRASPGKSSPSSTAATPSPICRRCRSASRSTSSSGAPSRGLAVSEHHDLTTDTPQRGTRATMPFSFLAREAGRVHVCGHRGYSLRYPENTLPALQAAKAAGATTVEIDVVLTADGEPIVLHDLTLDRTTDGCGFAADLGLDHIRGLDAGAGFHPRFAGTRVPTLAEALDWATREAMGLVLEIKEAERPDLAVDRVAALLEASGATDRVIVISFDHVVLKRAVRAPSGHCGPRPSPTPATPTSSACCGRAARSSVSIELDMFHPDDAKALHDAGFSNRVHLPRPEALAEYWRGGRDIIPRVVEWIADGLIDTISGDDVPFIARLVERAGRAGGGVRP